MANLLRFAGVQVKTGGLSRSTIWRLERDGLFPKRRLVTGKIVAWDEAEVDERIRSCNKEVGPIPSRSLKAAEGKSCSKDAVRRSIG
jgi:predicted DNA-binding transcriptional regulator AlpA